MSSQEKEKTEISYSWMDDGYLGDFTLKCGKCGNKSKPETFDTSSDNPFVCPKCGAEYKVKIGVHVE